MKLSHYTLRHLFLPMLLLFAVWGWVFYLMVLHEVEDETDDTLENYKEIIIRSALADSTLLKDHTDIMSRYYIREVPAEEAKLDEDEFFDSTVYIEIEKEYEPVRVLRTYFMTDNRRYYELTVEISTLEEEDMIETMVWGMLALYVLLIGCVMLVIHYGFKKSFRPLYRLLDWLKTFQVGKPVIPLDNPTPIDEFK
ncbi:MAG: sensor histidine kinase, partial [Bacteroidaceae bacterium]|nr:sensor histidine kinase [Bacteroidaceae bacterium]